MKPTPNDVIQPEDEVTNDELGEELGISASRVAQMRMAAIRPASLDAPIGDEDSNNFSEVVQDESADTPYQHLEGKTIRKVIVVPGRIVNIVVA